MTALISGAALVWSIATAEQSNEPKVVRFRTLPLMILVATACSTLFLAFYAFAFRATEFYPSGDPSQAPSGSPFGVRVPAITVAAGLFGGVLFVAFTVLKYRSHVQADERLDIEQREAKLKTAEHFSERFGQAAEMLGSERSATRIGGVYALAALADEWRESRQQCVDLLCGYMRTPIQKSPTWGSENESVSAKEEIPPPPSTPRLLLPRPENSPIVVELDVIADYRSERTRIAGAYVESSRADEVEVRRAVLSSIARGTRRSLDDATSWSDMTFDLSRCYLPGVDFSGCRFLQKVDFNGSIFSGSANMREAFFAQNAQFDGCIFTGRAWFSRVIFAGHAWFRAAEFCKEARFGGTVFEAGMLFNFAYFNEVPHFRDNSLGNRNADVLQEIPFANWDGVRFEGDFTACPDAQTPSVWSSFSYRQRGYTLTCEQPHDDRAMSLSNIHDS
ncbi:pentapeptide repeat-containing protein [Arthrobacter oryzae]|uniref:pentapeptide repeat-containing protein n=1 Tax=Arthrobacter oryzae TaxID=409290 RepID=UPI0028663604|nr:pentapeptide repeat-containing protein [Arthrobacter oryzae]MDR6506478.1 uncharacterized protein YjbI with pentapeptide repeats [Arthrobacter oryzae]